MLKNRIEPSNKEELEKALTDSGKITDQKFTSEILETLKKQLGDFEIIL